MESGGGGTGKAVAFLTAAPLSPEYHHSRNLSPNTTICMNIPNSCCSLQRKHFRDDNIGSPERSELRCLEYVLLPTYSTGFNHLHCTNDRVAAEKWTKTRELTSRFLESFNPVIKSSCLQSTFSCAVHTYVHLPQLQRRGEYQSPTWNR